MQIIDFDAKFTDVLNDWIEKNRSRFRKPDDMENEVPDVYLRWLNTPASWLDGATPGTYFEKFDSAAELCELCEEDKAAVSRSLLYLEQKGFLIRENPSADAPREGSKHYRSPLHLTEQGNAIAERLAQRVDHVLEAVSNGVSEEDRANLYRTLEQINRNLRELCDKYEEELPNT